jgi:alpha-ketoglutarate-dependent taurine dioxygenase
MRLEAWLTALIDKYMTLAAPAKHSIIKRELAMNGFVLIPGLMESSAVDLINEFGPVMLRTDICPRANARGDVSTNLAMSFHTDHPRARWIAWYCVQQSSEGGESLLVDSGPLVSALTTDELRILRNTRARTHQVFPGDDATHSILSPVEGGTDQIYYAHWLISDDSSEPLRKLGDQIAKAAPVRIRLNAGELMIIDNARMLHGRTSISGDRCRLLRRYWISEDGAFNTIFAHSPKQ